MGMSKTISAAEQQLRDDLISRARKSRQSVFEYEAYKSMMTPDERNVPVAVDVWLGTLNSDRLNEFLKRVTKLVNDWK